MNADPEAAPVQVEPRVRTHPRRARELDETRALELLGRSGVGRVVYTVGALPAVLPVRFRLDALGGVLLSTAADSELARAVDGAVIAFEADEVDDTDGTGWCVTVLGRAELREPSAAPNPSPAPSPAPASGARVEIRIAPELVVGRDLMPDPF
ncbi:pyridoxamine 5'-phosphate oxidase family protein [Kitasatospora sp. NPDC057692]|uniref:pyridoxamine 5'-phosphate oxidase family protein n=1 Tax=Kitasatospora sp. NPDC057692 TaxID=3346215 RepID=UPI00368C7D11